MRATASAIQVQPPIIFNAYANWEEYYPGWASLLLWWTYDGPPGMIEIQFCTEGAPFETLALVPVNTDDPNFIHQSFTESAAPYYVRVRYNTNGIVSEWSNVFVISELNYV